MVSIELRDVGVSLGGHDVLRGLDLAVASGEWMAVLGGSGSGKSTLLRTVVGLQPPAAGSVHFGDVDVTRTAPNARDVGFVAQGAPLFDHLDVHDNLAFPLAVQQVDDDEQERRIQSELRAFGLDRLSDRRPETLSAGERHAAATAHSTVRLPSVMVFDEPVSALDADRRREVLGEVRRLAEGTDATILMATNDPAVAAHADRVAVVVGGAIGQAATYPHLYAAPASLEVADLTGTWPVNRLAADVVAVPGQRTRLKTIAGSLQTWHELPAAHRQVTVAVRPADLLVTSTPTKGGGAPQGAAASLPERSEVQVVGGTVTRVAPMGHASEVRLDADGLELVAVDRGATARQGRVAFARVRRAHVYGLDGTELAHLDLATR